MNKQAQQLSINFLVLFIISVVVFGLGVLLMWNIFFSSSETIDISQGEFDRRIAAINCKPSDTVCVGANSLEIDSGESVLINMRIFNNHNNNLDYTIDYDLRDENNVIVLDSTGDHQLLPGRYVGETVPAKQDREFDILFKTENTLPSGEYALRIAVNPAGLDEIPRRINIRIS